MPTAVIAGADDLLFPPELQQRIAAERLGIDDVEIIPGGHLVAMANPAPVADRLVRGAR